ncbi:MAG: SH3 domain-containing protein, partial [Firmicutes bacterium]|nr:SH3 domain-containing protein [Bacillota bacterium]
LVKNCAAGSIPGTVDPVYAVSVRRTVSYVLPSDDFVSGEPDEKYINDMVSAEVMPFTGVVILHESADKEWSFILNGTVCGWTRTEDLCICSDKDQWLAAARPESFITVTGCEIVMDETAVPTASSGMVLPMGTKLRLASGSTTAVSGRSALGCYTVEIPFRRDDGTLGFEQALVPVSEDVCEGYPAMTSSSVIEQAFKFLGRVYGWGGTLSSNDCSGFIRQVYSCYGFELPRNSLAIATLTDLGRSDCSEMTLPRKRQVIKNMPAGQLLYMDGHLMLYLGMDGDKPYVISSCASYIDPQSKEMVDANCVFVSGLDLLRKNGKTWLESISYFQDRDY